MREIYTYRAHVDEQMLGLPMNSDPARAGEVASLLELGLRLASGHAPGDDSLGASAPRLPNAEPRVELTLITALVPPHDELIVAPRQFSHQ